MAVKCVTAVIMCAILALVIAQRSQRIDHQGLRHENQGRIRRQAPQVDDLELLKANWTSCDVTTSTVMSCHDCNTRLICKPVGGLLIACKNPYRPYCNTGICSAVPSAECT